MSMIYKLCPECKSKMKMRIKLAGLICNGCGTVIVLPNTDEYKKAIIDLRKKQTND